MKLEIKLEKKQIIYACVLGVLCSLGFFLSMTRIVTPENTPELLEDTENLIYGNQTLIWIRMMYLSFSGNRLKVALFALSVSAIIYISRQKDWDNYHRISFAIFSLIFSIAQLLAMSYKKIGSWDYLIGTPEQQIRAIIKGISFGILCYYSCRLLYHGLLRFGMQEEKSKALVGKKGYLCSVLAMFLAWLPYFVIFYPGTSNEDTIIQIMEYFEIPSYIQKMSAVQGPDIFITNHHPFALTMLFSWFVKLGLNIGDIRIGVAIYTILHMIFLAGVFSYGLLSLRKWGVSRKRVKGLQIMFMFLPIFPLYSICMVKDTLYAAFCLLFFFLMYEIYESKGEVLKRWSYCLAVAVVGLLMMLTKVYGMYVLIGVLVVYLWKFRREYKICRNVICSILVPILFYHFVYLGMFLPACNVAPGGKQEALSVPFQQTARYVSVYPDEVTKKEKEVINQVLPYKKLSKLYEPELSDRVKKQYRQEATEKELKEYIKVWFLMFCKHPGVYIEATLHNTYQYFDLNKISGLEYYEFHQYLQNHDKKGEYQWLYVENLEKFAGHRYAIKQIVMFLQKVPIINLLLSMGFFPWIIIFFVLYNFLTKKKGKNVVWMIPVLTMLVCFLSPDNGNSRYIMPIIYILPYIFFLELVPKEEKMMYNESCGNEKPLEKI